MVFLWWGRLWKAIKWLLYWLFILRVHSQWQADSWNKEPMVEASVVALYSLSLAGKVMESHQTHTYTLE